MIVAAVLVWALALQGSAPHHHRHHVGEFPPFPDAENREPDHKFVLDGVDLSGMAGGPVVRCRPSVGCTLDIAVTGDEGKTLASFRKKAPASVWIEWKPPAIPAKARVTLRILRPESSPAGTLLLVFPAVGQPLVDDLKIDPAEANVHTDRAVCLSYLLSAAGSAAFSVMLEPNGAVNSASGMVPYLMAGAHEFRWELGANTPRGMYGFRFEAAEDGVKKPAFLGFVVFCVAARL